MKQENPWACTEVIYMHPRDKQTKRIRWRFGNLGMIVVHDVTNASEQAFAMWRRWTKKQAYLAIRPYVEAYIQQHV